MKTFKQTNLFYPKHKDLPIIDGHVLYFDISEFIDRLYDKDLFQIDNIGLTKWDNGLISIDVNWSMPRKSYKTKKLKEYSFSRFKYCNRISTTYSDYIATDLNFGAIRSQPHSAHLSIGLKPIDNNNERKYDFSHVEQTKYGVNVWFKPNMSPIENINWILSKDETELIQSIESKLKNISPK